VHRILKSFVCDHLNRIEACPPNSSMIPIILLRVDSETKRRQNCFVVMNYAHFSMFDSHYCGSSFRTVYLISHDRPTRSLGFDYMMVFSLHQHFPQFLPPQFLNFIKFENSLTLKNFSANLAIFVSIHIVGHLNWVAIS